jgi:hypothetical protein
MPPFYPQDLDPSYHGVEFIEPNSVAISAWMAPIELLMGQADRTQSQYRHSQKGSVPLSDDAAG